MQVHEVQSRVLAAHYSIGGPYFYKGVPILALIYGDGSPHIYGVPIFT